MNRVEWKELKARGKRAFVIQGGLRRGLPMGVALAVAVEVIQGHPLPDALGTGSFLGRALLACALFSVGGCLTAAAQWRALEQRFANDPFAES